jgi:HEAT repeat protein
LGLSITLLERRDDPTSRKRVLELVRSALADPASDVRSEAVREIGSLDERQEFVPILQKISKDDPEKFPRKAPDGSDAADFYPVRYDAGRVLREIRNNKICAQ